MTVQRDIDTLTELELRVYLQLAEGDWQAPQTRNKTEMTQALKARVVGNLVRPLDINLAAEKTLAVAGLTSETIEALRQRRPILRWRDVETLPGLTAANRRMIAPLFIIQPIRMPSGSFLTASEEAPAIQIVSNETESAADLAYHLLKEGEAKSDSRVLPAYKDAAGTIRYLDPRFVAAQMSRSVEDADVAQLFSTAGVMIFRRFATAGLVMLRLESERHGAAALNVALAVLAASPLTSIVEPAWISTDRIEIQPQILATPQRDVEAAGGPGTGSTTTAWNLYMVGVGTLGSGDPAVTLVAVDTGVDGTHPAIAASLVPQAAGETRNYVVGPNILPDDDDGHGTSVAGILVGNGAGGIRGMAPSCSLIVLKVPLFGSLSAYALRRVALLSLGNI